MSDYRIPVIYDASHYRDKYVEGKDVGTWMINTLKGVLVSHGFQPADPKYFQDITDKQKDSDNKIFVGKIEGANWSGIHFLEISDSKPRELTVSINGQVVESVSNDELIEEFRSLLEKSYFIRSKHQFEKIEREEIISDENVSTKTANNSETSKGGCYIATAVYGSYDCPEVWTLRRFRDENLQQSATGRLFVKTYYALSPKVVKVFGETKWFNRFWQSRLDRLVARLKADGYKDTPYRDK